MPQPKKSWTPPPADHTCAPAESSELRDLQHPAGHGAPHYLYKIVSREEWSQSLQGNALILSPMDDEFIHLAQEDQVDHVAKKFWGGRDFLTLKLDPNKLEGQLVLEANPGGTTLYYHLYDGSIPLEAVSEVIPATSASQ